MRHRAVLFAEHSQAQALCDPIFLRWLIQYTLHFPFEHNLNLQLIGLQSRDHYQQQKDEGLQATLPHQVVLHFKHPHHSSDCFRFQPLLLLTDPLQEVQG